MPGTIEWLQIKISTNSYVYTFVFHCIDMEATVCHRNILVPHGHSTSTKKAWGIFVFLLAHRCFNDCSSGFSGSFSDGSIFLVVGISSCWRTHRALNRVMNSHASVGPRDSLQEDAICLRGEDHTSPTEHTFSDHKELKECDAVWVHHSASLNPV